MPMLERCVNLCPYISIPNLHTIAIVIQGRTIEGFAKEQTSNLPIASV